MVGLIVEMIRNYHHIKLKTNNVNKYIDKKINLKIYFQLRYLQTLNSISVEQNSTIIFPFPISITGNDLEKNI